MIREVIDEKRMKAFDILFADAIEQHDENHNRLEKEFLKLISKIELSERDIVRINELVFSGMEWGYIHDKVRANFIAPFFVKNVINKNWPMAIASDIIVKIENIHYRQARRNTHIYTELKKILNAFNQSGIKVMIIKGAHLGEEIYGDTLLRWMSDIDILAKVEDRFAIKNILSDLGYGTDDKNYDEWGLRHLDNHIAFFKEGVRLELKFNMWQMDFPYFDDDLWQRARNITLAGEKARVPSTEDTLLIACVNLARHNYTGLIWLCDIREIISKFKETIDWDTFAARAVEKDIDCMAYYALYYSSRLLNYEMTSAVLRRLKPSPIKTALHNFFWDEKVILWQKEGSPQRARIAFELSVLLFGGKIKFQPRKLIKMSRYIIRIMIPPGSHILKRSGIERNPEKLVLYYLLRLVRLTFMPLRALMAVISGRKR